MVSYRYPNDWSANLLLKQIRPPAAVRECVLNLTNMVQGWSWCSGKKKLPPPEGEGSGGKGQSSADEIQIVNLTLNIAEQLLNVAQLVLNFTNELLAQGNLHVNHNAEHLSIHFAPGDEVVLQLHGNFDNILVGNCECPWVWW